MLCPECNIAGGCYCHITKKVRHVPRDHKKEAEEWQAWAEQEEPKIDY